jgi:23S rRNA G2445 N2-methylase RlmL
LFELFAVTNRGIESICAAEMARLRGLEKIHTAYRRVHATYSGDIANLLRLRTVDDLFIHLAEWQGVHSHRSALALLQELALDLDLWHALNLRARLYPLVDEITFSVSANFVGRRNYSATEIKIAVAKSVESMTGWRYSEDDRQSDLNLRIFIEHESAVVGMRLASAPLYKRAYKAAHLPGSLKPTVAAAMLFLAQVMPQQRVLDPCCGAGTILIEAATLGATASGGDHDAAAVAAALDNANDAGVEIDVQSWDARALPLAGASVHHSVSNLPWGRQVEVESGLEEFYCATCAELERVVAGDGYIVLLTNRPQLINFPNRTIQHQIEISLFGQQPTIVVASPNANTLDRPE